MNSFTCLRLTNMALDSFRPNPAIDSDPFMKRSRQALMDAIVFFLYSNGEPEAMLFARVLNILKSSRKQLRLKRHGIPLDFMWGEDKEGWRE